MKQEHLETETVGFLSPPHCLHEHVGESCREITPGLAVDVYVFCLFCELLGHTPAQIMINALACLPSAFASLIIHCPPSSHPSGTGWPQSRGRAGAAGVPQQHRPICPRLQAVVSNPQLSRNQWPCGQKGRDAAQKGTSILLRLCRRGALSVKRACLSLHIPLPPSPHITHTWWQTRQQCCVCTCDYNLNSKMLIMSIASYRLSLVSYWSDLYIIVHHWLGSCVSISVSPEQPHPKKKQLF